MEILPCLCGMAGRGDCCILVLVSRDEEVHPRKSTEAFGKHCKFDALEEKAQPMENGKSFHVEKSAGRDRIDKG